ncbi:MAG: hypothetical protein ACYTGZ_06490 [Planctomycetota bacterium]|jgi:hypothetical protein
MIDSDLYYAPSHGFEAPAIPVMLALGGVAAAALGFAYGYLVHVNPFIYINVLATLGLGFAIGIAGGHGVTKFKVRWPALAGTLALVVGVFAVYISWIAWSHALVADAGGDIWIVNPANLFEFMKLVAEDGAWSIGSMTPTGIVLWAIWALEAGIIAVLPAYLSWQSARKPFCENCEAWTEAEMACATGSTNDHDSLVRSLERGDVLALAKLGPAEGRAYTRATVNACNSCRDTAFLTVESVTIDTKKDKDEENSSTVVENLILSPETRARAMEIPTLVEPAANEQPADEQPESEPPAPAEE